MEGEIKEIGGIIEARPSFPELARQNEILQERTLEVAKGFLKVLGSLKTTGVIAEDRDIPLNAWCCREGEEGGYIRFETPEGDVHVSNVVYGNLRHVLAEDHSEDAMTAEGPLVLQMSIDNRFFRNSLGELGTQENLEDYLNKNVTVLQLGMVQPDRVEVDKGEKFYARRKGDAGDFPNSVSLEKRLGEPFAVKVEHSGGRDLLEEFNKTVGRLKGATSREIVREKVGGKA